MAADTQPSVLSGALKRPFNEQVAFFRGKLGNLVPTRRWSDLWKSAHDRGFMVAGAAKADLLSDLAAAVDRAVSEGQSLEAFRKDFRAIVERNGWHGWTGERTARGRAWRTRVIYQTNTATSYSAGRFAQLKEGGFDRWIYRHNDSVLYPRPQHLAWNGLTLPPDHPFWEAHYPPNGWGCRCYVMGARSDRGAQRLGGEPGKQPPEGWNAIDGKTGEPPGIDKGWGYAPGHAVAHTVQEMARKTQQWDYQLAKGYMQGAPASVRDQLATSYRGLPSVADDARRYAQRILAGRTHLEIPPRRTLGLVTSSNAAKIRRGAGVAVKGFDFALDPAAIKDIGQAQGVAAADYARLPALLNAPDRIDAKHPNAITIEKTFGAERWTTTWKAEAPNQSLIMTSLKIEGRR